jgi:hypothetical protein
MVTQLALPFAAIQVLGAGAAELGALRALVLVPGFALGLAAGAWLDRLRRRPVLVASDLARAAVQASVAAAAALGALTMDHLYAVALAAGFLGFLFHVAREAYLPSLVPRGALVSANARLRGGEAVSEGAGFGAGGWLVQLIGAPQALLVDGATFLASAALLARIRRKEPPPAPRGARGRGPRAALGEVREGLELVLRHPALRPLAISGALLAASSARPSARAPPSPPVPQASSSPRGWCGRRASLAGWRAFSSSRSGCCAARGRPPSRGSIRSIRRSGWRRWPTASGSTRGS